MDRESNFDVPLHYSMAVFGGFVGAYALLARMQVFGSAQTANLIEIICDILGKNPGEVLLRVGALAIYVGAIALSVILTKSMSRNIKYLAIVFDMIAVILLGFFPASMNPVEALYPVFFITAFQWCVFKGAKGYVSSTIFSTNNLKQTVLSFTEYLISEDGDENKKKKAEKAIFFGGTLLSFHTGVGFGYLMWLACGIHSIWFGCIPLFTSVLILFLGDMKFKIYEQKKDSVSCC